MQLISSSFVSNLWIIPLLMAAFTASTTDFLLSEKPKDQELEFYTDPKTGNLDKTISPDWFAGIVEQNQK